MKRTIRNIIGIRNYFKLFYFIKRKRFLSLKRPKNLSEKIIYRRLNPQIVFTILSDKVKVREYVKKKIGETYLVPIYGIYNELNLDILNNLPNSFVIKTNHGAGFNIVVNKKEEIDLTTTCRTVNLWLKEDYSKKFHEAHYKDIIPKVIIEKNLAENTKDLWDYKIHVFKNPEHKKSTAFLQIISGRFDSSGKSKRLWLDESLNKAPFLQKHYEEFKYDNLEADKPILLEMISLAKKLTSNLHYCRIDFYMVNGSIYFGEMTFTPHGGNLYFSPNKWDKILGELFSWPEPNYYLSEL